jgi:hypothetical protein
MGFTNTIVIDVSDFVERLYPIETYWGFNPSKRFWVPLALTDPALLSAILWVSDNFQATLIGQKKERPSGVNHLQQAIQILNERLRNPSQVISDSTIAAVASLALLEVGTITASIEIRLPILSSNQLVNTRIGKFI